MSQENKSSYKWMVLTVFTAVAGVSQMLWLNFAPLITQLMEKYNKSEGTISWLILVFPLLYVVLSIPSGIMIDKKGYKYTVGLGSIIIAIFSILRIFESNFYILLIGQIGIAIGQPFVVNGISKLVADWFHKDEHALATGLATVGLFVGMALGMGLTPALVEGESLTKAMIVFAIISTVSCFLFLVFGKENRKLSEQEDNFSGIGEFVAMFKQKDLLLIFIMAFLALGYFNGLTTWLEPMLFAQNISADQAGMAGAMLIVGGIFGSIIIPPISDKIKRRKPILMICCALGLILTYPFCTNGNYTTLLILGFTLGFLFLPGYALLLTASEELVGLEKAGVATSLLMLMGNAGGTIVVIVMPMLKGNQDNWINPIYLMLALLVAAIGLGFAIKETYSYKSH